MADGGSGLREPRHVIGLIVALVVAGACRLAIEGPGRALDRTAPDVVEASE